MVFDLLSPESICPNFATNHQYSAVCMANVESLFTLPKFKKKKKNRGGLDFGWGLIYFSKRSI